MNGERRAVSVLRVPTPDEEDQRRLNKERERLIKERGAHVVRIESLLVRIGIHMPIVRNFPEWLENVGDGLANEPGSDIEAELLWEYERLQLAARQLEELLQGQKRRVEEEDTKATERIMTSIQSKGIG
uniref:Transposase n=1 Tax=Candidatus Kentrum sp. TC TaxID=2126339 RepID=A0A450ZGA7_9GAMM|nr:MAG: transposase [Candidatus Kentron sp. TC]